MKKVINSYYTVHHSTGEDFGWVEAATMAEARRIANTLAKDAKFIKVWINGWTVFDNKTYNQHQCWIKHDGSIPVKIAIQKKVI